MTKINIEYPPYSETRSLESVTKKKLSAFFKKNTCIAEADIKLSHGSDAISDKVCKIYLKTTLKNMFTVQTGASFEASLSNAIGKLQAQLNSI